MAHSKKMNVPGTLVHQEIMKTGKLRVFRNLSSPHRHVLYIKWYKVYGC